MAIFKIKNTWYIDYYFNGKRIREAIGPNKKLAEQALYIRKANIAKGKFEIQDIKHSITFMELAKIYIEYAKGNKKSWKRDITSLNKLLPYFGNMRLNDISPYKIEQYKLQRRDEVLPATVNRELACMKHMFNLAIKWGKTKKNPVKEVTLFKEQNRRLKFLSEDEIHRLIANCSPQLKPLVITALSTGMRRGEIFKLKWKDIDFENNLITLSDTKSGYLREIKIDDDLKEYLLGLKSKARNEYVFLNRNGEPYRDVKTAFKTALRKAGIEGVTFHTLRHTFAAHHAMKGTPIPTLMKLMGHRTIAMTMRYSHLSPDHLQQRVNIFQRTLKIIDRQNMDKSNIDAKVLHPEKH
ncbi:MAG: hypothetical protein B5M53_10675 [Candidatus Cloacimonas sp. 4484_209]|nr:MAG: hypothetical protein B5M53_10675 [Candidatus Cloacimonas sp. 4484_209]